MRRGESTPATRAGVLVTLVLTTLLAGCGGSSGNGVAAKSAAEILAASRAAASGATSVHIVSKVSQGPVVLTFNLKLASSGGRAQVSLAGLDYEVIRVGDTLYAKGNAVFDARLARLDRAAAKVPVGAWLKAPANSGQLAQLAAVTDLSGELSRWLGSAAVLTKGLSTAVNGQPVIELKETARLFSGSLYVATTGKPYPIKLVKRGRETGQTTFTDWNQPVSLAPPANAIAIG
jgi:hypothetical protein